MPIDRTNRPETFLSRWSRRKLAATRTAPAVEAPGEPNASGLVGPAAPATPPAAELHAAAEAAVELPPVESLTFESDFTAYLRPGVEPGVQRAALRKLLRDQRFNTMDGLDVYIDDYSKPSPLDPAVARTLAHAKALFDPPRTRINAQGYVEEIPPETVEGEAPAESTTAAQGTLERADDALPPAAVPGEAPLGVATPDAEDTR